MIDAPADSGTVVLTVDVVDAAGNPLAATVRYAGPDTGSLVQSFAAGTPRSVPRCDGTCIVEVRLSDPALTPVPYADRAMLTELVHDLHVVFRPDAEPAPVPGQAVEVVVPESLIPVWVHVSDAVGAPKDVEVGFAIDGAGERQWRSAAGVVALRQTHAPCRLMVEGRTVLKLGAGLVSPIELFIQA